MPDMLARHRLIWLKIVCLDLNYMIVACLKFAALTYGLIISSLSKSGIDEGNLRVPRPGKRLSFLGWLPSLF